MAQERHGDAEMLMRDVLAGQTLLYGEDGQTTLITKEVLAVILDHVGQTHEAESLFREVVAGKIQLYGGADNLDVCLTQASLAGVIEEVGGRNEEAEELYRSILAVMTSLRMYDNATANELIEDVRASLEQLEAERAPPSLAPRVLFDDAGVFGDGRDKGAGEGGRVADESSGCAAPRRPSETPQCGSAFRFFCSS